MIERRARASGRSCGGGSFALLLAVSSAGCIDFRKDLEEFCARNPSRCAAGDGGTAGGQQGGGSGGGAMGGGSGGGGGATGGGSGGGSGGGGGGGGGVDAGSCMREACLDRNYFVPDYLWTTSGSQPTDVWFGGTGLYRYDGTGPVQSRSDNPALARTLFGLSATAPNDVWIAGRTDPDAFRFDGVDWRSKKFDGGDAVYGLYARATDDAYLVAGYNIFHWDGGSWDFIYKNPSSETFYDVHGVPGSPVYAVASSDKVYRIDEQLAVTVELPGVGSEDLYAINVAPNGNVWAVGSSGTVVHRTDDGGWSLVAIDVGGSTSYLYGVWARTDDDLWVAGELGTFLHWRADAGWTSRGADAFDGGVNLTNITWQDMWGQGKHLWVAGTTGVGGFNSDYDGGVAAHFLLP